MYNGLMRKDHETLDNSDLPKLFGVQLKFMSLNRNCRYDMGLAERQCFNQYLTLPLTNEKIQVPDEFRKALNETLAALPAKDLIDNDDPKLLNMIQVVQKNSEAFSEYVTEKELCEKIDSQLCKIITNPTNTHFSFRTMIDQQDDADDHAGVVTSGVADGSSQIGMHEAQGADKSQAKKQGGKAPLFLALSCEANEEAKKDCMNKLH